MKGKERVYNKRRTRAATFCAVFVLIFLFVFFSTAIWKMYEARNKSNITSLSENYLQEIAMQEEKFLKSSVNSSFAQIRTIANLVSKEDLLTQEAFGDFLLKAQEASGFTHIAFICEDGSVYSEEGKLANLSADSKFGRLLKEEGNFVLLDETMWDSQAILLGTSMKDMGKSFEEKRLVAIAVGISISDIRNQQIKEKNEAEAAFCIIDKDGSLLIPGTNLQEWYGTNIVLSLEEKAELDENYSLEKVRTGLEEKRVEMLSFIMDGEREYLYFQPIDGTEWILCTGISYAALNLQVAVPERFVLWIFIGTLSIVFVVLMVNGQKNKKMFLDEKERKEAANKAKIDFLSRMSYEIRTPLSGIVGMVALGRQSVDRPERLKDCLDKVEICSEQLLSTINDVLDMSKIESGKIELNETSFELAFLLKSLTTVFYSQAREKGIEFVLHLEGGITEQIVADFLRLNQILINLLSNAVKFTQKGGRIVFEVSEEKMEGEKMLLCFKVTDTGCGIREENVSHIFDMFEQDTVAKHFEGIGLGLPATKYFVEMMGGSISLETKEGLGSSFLVNIPVSYTVHHASEGGCGRGKRALVVNYDLKVNTHLVYLLKQEGFKVDTAHTLQETADKIEEKSKGGETYEYCFVYGKFMDLESFIAETKVKYTKTAPKIILTGYDKEELDDLQFFSGAYDSLLCPVVYEDLMLLLNPGMEKKRVQKNDFSEADFTGKRILVAEDNEINMEIAIELLRGAGAYVDFVWNGEEAVEKFEMEEENFYDIILMDMRMPVMDGCTASMTIRGLAREDAGKVLIFAMTANALEEDARKCVESGMDAHIAKPFTVKNIYEQYQRLRKA